MNQQRSGTSAALGNNRPVAPTAGGHGRNHREHEPCALATQPAPDIGRYPTNQLQCAAIVNVVAPGHTATSSSGAGAGACVRSQLDHSIIFTQDASGGVRLRAMTSIAHALAESAARYANRAVDNYIGKDLSEFYLAAGIAVEQAMKSRLARENVVFIAPERGFTSAVELWRTRDDIASLPVGTKTIGGADAVARVAVVEKGFIPHVESVKEILRFRNGEAHVGAPGASDHRKVFVDFLAAIAALLEV